MPLRRPSSSAHRPSAPLALALALAVAALAAGCTRDAHAKPSLPIPRVDLPAAPGDKSPRTAVFAAGCFWCIEAAFDRVAGVTDVVSGYAGGTRPTATYDQVSAGTTDHAEAVRVTYDPTRISYGQLLRVLFTIHDPTTKDRQGPDWGRQYRSAVFFATSDERRAAAAYIQQLSDARAFSAPIVTTLEKLDAFYPAEQYHQDYVRKHPDHPYVVAWLPAKLTKLRAGVPELLKPE